LKRGRWDLSASDIQSFNETLQWVQGLAANIAPKLRGVTAPSAPATAAADAPTQGFKIKAMGPIGGPAPRKAKKKK
jgi:hypothetical protein